MPSLRLLTYNVRYFGHATRGLASRDRTMHRVADALAHLQGGPPDLICLQEIETHSIRADMGRSRRESPESPRRPQLERFVHAFQTALAQAGSNAIYAPFYYPAHAYRLGGDTNLYTTGLAILVLQGLELLGHNTQEPHDITHRRLQRLSRWKQTRICAHLRLVHRNGHTIDVFNTHLSLPAFFTSDLWSYTRRLGFGKNQLEEAKRLVDFVEATRAPKSATLLVGDFNTLPGSPVYEYLTNERRLRDAFRELHDVQPSLQDYPTAGLLGLRLPIDYIFSCDRLQWLDFDGTHSFGLDGGAFDGLSDHVPLVARFRVPLT